MRTENEIREKIEDNRKRMGSDKISQSSYISLSDKTQALLWVLNE